MKYYQKTVSYIIGVRRFVGDEKGYTLTTEHPYIGIKDDDVRDFKLANKRAFLTGLIMETDEPSVDWETPNAMTDDNISAMLKLNYYSLKNEVQKITSLPIMAKIVDIARSNERPKKTMTLLEDRLGELAKAQKVEILERQESRQAFD